MKPYASLTAKSQVARIRRALDGVVEANWELAEPRLRLVSHAYNTTFRVDTAGTRYALRVNTASTHSIETLQTEIAFAQHLTAAKSFKVAAPIPKADGTYIAEVPGLERPIFAVLYEWLPDPTVGDKPTPEVLRSLGQATQELHQLGATFPHNFRILEDPYYGDPYRLPSQDLDLPLFEECAARVQSVFDKLADQPKIPLHADLHLYNLKFGKTNRLSIFDFDDAMTSWPVIDAAISMWYLRRHPRAQELEPYYWDGFTTPTGLTKEDFETLVAARTLLLVNDIVGSQNATARLEATRFVRRAEALLRHYRSTGRFAPWEVS